MNKEEHIKQLIEKAMNSADGATRATPAPYLFTRVNARIKTAKNSYWTVAVEFFSRPAIAFSALIMLIVVNVTAIYFYQQNVTGIIAEEVVIESTEQVDDTDISIFDMVNNEQ